MSDQPSARGLSDYISEGVFEGWPIMPVGAWSDHSPTVNDRDVTGYERDPPNGAVVVSAGAFAREESAERLPDLGHSRGDLALRVHEHSIRSEAGHQSVEISGTPGQVVCRLDREYLLLGLLRHAEHSAP